VNVARERERENVTVCNCYPRHVYMYASFSIRNMLVGADNIKVSGKF
jgi:hypothetical protein